MAPSCVSIEVSKLSIFQPELEAHLVQRRALRYTTAADSAWGRPPHVRAGSSLNWVGGKLAVLQDDTSFIALVDPESGSVESIALPPDSSGRRVFDGKQGKADKLDFECGVVIEVEQGPVLIAFGSGSTSKRETLAIVGFDSSGAGHDPEIRLVPAPHFYSRLRECTWFSGSELNLEGAAVIGGERLWLFQRGNGASRGLEKPVNAVCEISWRQLWQHLQSGNQDTAPELRSVVRYELGAVEGTPLTFTDAAVVSRDQVGPAVVYVASAERSLDTYQDGEILGATIGVLTDDLPVWTWLIDERGECIREKVEGIAMHPEHPGRAFICIDPDDPDRPTDLCEIEFRGPWPFLL